MAELRAYNPSLREKIMWGIAGKAGDWFGAGRYAQQDIAQKVGGLIDFVPGVGDAVGVDDAYRDYQSGNYGLAAAGLGLTAAGAIPGVGDAVANAGRKGIRAFHGSPHSFDKFSVDKIGSGEGAQAYGHGLYFAENEGVAQGYRAALSDLPFPDGDPANAAYTLLNVRGEEAARNMLSGSRTPEEVEALIARAKDARSGHMYEVNINADPDAFLDWDRPVSELDGAPRLVMEKELRRYLGRVYDNQIGNYVDRTAGDILGELNNPLGLRNAAVEEGIPGIKYFDSGSRGTEDGSRNYVVFDDSLIEIVKKYGLAGAVAAGLISQEMAAQMQAQGIEEL